MAGFIFNQGDALNALIVDKERTAMTTTHHDYLPSTRGSSGLSRPRKTALLMAAIVRGFYLLREHWSHVTGNWVYLLLLACPLMYLFHGTGGHGERAAPPDTRTE